MTTTPEPTAPRPRYLRVAETAKLVRAALKPAFPGVTFSVRSSSYSGGASIDVSWTDGPTVGAVTRVAGPFAGAGFDGMIDLKTGKTTWYCPTHGARTAENYGHSYASQNGPVMSRCCARSELVHMGADYVHTVRRFTDAARTILECMAARSVGREVYVADERDPWNQDWMTAHFHRAGVETAFAVDPLTGDPVVVADPRYAPTVPTRAAS